MESFWEVVKFHITNIHVTFNSGNHIYFKRLVTSAFYYAFYRSEM